MQNYCGAPWGTDVGGGTTDTQPWSDWICFATEFDATASSTYKPYFYLDQDADGNWTGNGWGGMMCVPQCCFQSNGGSQDVAWLSGMFEADAQSSGTSSSTTDTAMWLGDAMSFMAGAYHRYGAMGTRDQVQSIAGSPTSLSYFEAHSYHNSTVGGVGYSFFVGIPHSGHVVNSVTYSVADGRTEMIPLGSGICTLTAVSQQDDTHFAQIYLTGTLETGHWWLNANTTYAQYATCYYYDQSQ